MYENLINTSDAETQRFLRVILSTRERNNEELQIEFFRKGKTFKHSELFNNKTRNNSKFLYLRGNIFYVHQHQPNYKQLKFLGNRI